MAELLEWWPDESTSTAVATTLGATEPARRWVVSLPEGDVLISSGPLADDGTLPADTTAWVRLPVA